MLGDGATYASKAFLCRRRPAGARGGMRIDVATGGELQVVLAAGVPPSAPSRIATTSRSTNCDWHSPPASGASSSTATTKLDHIESPGRLGFCRAEGAAADQPRHRGPHPRARPYGNLDSSSGSRCPPARPTTFAGARASAASTLVPGCTCTSAHRCSASTTSSRAYAPGPLRRRRGPPRAGGRRRPRRRARRGRGCPTITEWVTAVVDGCRRQPPRSASEPGRGELAPIHPLGTFCQLSRHAPTVIGRAAAWAITSQS